MKEQFIKLLEEDAAQAHNAAEAWKVLAQNGGLLQDLNGKTIASAPEMVEMFTAREKDFRARIASIKAMP